MSEESSAPETAPADGQTETTQMASDWRAALPENIQAWDEVKNSDSADKFWNQIANQRSMIGQSIRIPTGDAGEDAMNTFYEKVQNKVDGLMRTPDPSNEEQMNDVWSKLGRPEDADGYTSVEAEGFDPNNEDFAHFKSAAHEAGLTKTQFEKLAGKLVNRDLENGAKAKQNIQQELEALKGEWGHAFDQRLTTAKNMAEKTGAPKEVVDAISNGTINKATGKWLYELSQQLGGEIANFREGQTPVATPAEIKGQLHDIMNNTKGPYWDSSHPQHAHYVKKVVELRRKLA